MTKISTPILWETTMEELIPKIKKLWENCQLLKQHYPTVWNSVKNQYKLECFPKSISDWLFERKLEINILQDEELRNK